MNMTVIYKAPMNLWHQHGLNECVKNGFQLRVVSTENRLIALSIPELFCFRGWQSWTSGRNTSHELIRWNAVINPFWCSHINKDVNRRPFRLGQGGSCGITNEQQVIHNREVLVRAVVGRKGSDYPIPGHWVIGRQIFIIHAIYISSI